MAGWSWGQKIINSDDGGTLEGPFSPLYDSLLPVSDVADDWVSEVSYENILMQGDQTLKKLDSCWLVLHWYVIYLSFLLSYRQK